MTAPHDSIHIDDLATPPAPAFTDEDSATVLDNAITSLVLLRFPAALEDTAADLHALASLILQAEAALARAVAQARDHDYGWDVIACCLNSSPSTARHHYYASRKKPPPRT